MITGEYVCPACNQTNQLPADTEEIYKDASCPEEMNVIAVCGYCMAKLCIPLKIKITFEQNGNIHIKNEPQI